MAVSSSVALREPRLDGDEIYWTEGRPHERGRQVIVRWNGQDGATDATPAPFNARTKAHEYGGGAYAVDGGTIYFVNFSDGRIYRQKRGADPEPLTEEGPYQHGDLVVDQARNRLLCVREDLSAVLDTDPERDLADGERPPEPADLLIAADLATGKVDVLASGHDFYSTPRPSADGGRIAWISWRHPNMPWDGTELWLAEVGPDGRLQNARKVAGGADESVEQPEWAPDGTLVFISDRSGWWNLYLLALDGGATAVAEPIAPLDAEFGGPQWVFGMTWYGIRPDGTIIARARQNGLDSLWEIPVGGVPRKLDLPEIAIDAAIQVAGNRLAYIGASPALAPSVCLLDLDSGTRRVLRRAFELAVDQKYISVPETIDFPTTDTDIAHAYYYPPTNPDFQGPDGERPPLVVMSHGGPTANSTPALDMGKQVFTSRGFGVVDVNYRGSSGYGREYMRRLDGMWGVYDVDDCIAAAQFLSERGDIDGERMAIRGGSAGGYTTLCALVFHDVFAAGASHYGVGDLEALSRFTHKFESRYLDRLVAPYPEGVEMLRARSPIYFIEGISSPVIVLQGEDDLVVPREQAEQLVASLRERRVPHAYLLFKGEGHGFRQAGNIRRSLEAELSFYAQVFGFDLGDSFDPVKVDFL